jgi:hypothetical protein
MRLTKPRADPHPAPPRRARPHPPTAARKIRDALTPAPLTPPPPYETKRVGSGLGGLEDIGGGSGNDRLTANDADARHVEVRQLLSHPLRRQLVGGLRLFAAAVCARWLTSSPARPSSGAKCATRWPSAALTVALATGGSAVPLPPASAGSPWAARRSLDKSTTNSRRRGLMRQPTPGSSAALTDSPRPKSPRLRPNRGGGSVTPAARLALPPRRSRGDQSPWDCRHRALSASCRELAPLRDEPGQLRERRRSPSTARASPHP